MAWDGPTLYLHHKAWCVFLPYLCSAFTVPTISTTRKILSGLPFVHPHPSIFSKIMRKFYLLCKFPSGYSRQLQYFFFELYLKLHIMSHCIFYLFQESSLPAFKKKKSTFLSETPKSNKFFRNKYKDMLFEYETDMKGIWLSYLVF